MAFSTTTLKLFKSLYWIIGIFAHLYVCYILITTERTITGIIWFILGLMLLWLMYPVYFPMGDPGSHWPPYIRSCPDYLTLYAPNQCVDYGQLNNPHIPSTKPGEQPTGNQIFNTAGLSMAQKAAKAQSVQLSWEGVN